MITMYGIKNCDTIKKARRWLEDNGIEYRFFDYKSEGAPADKLPLWIEQFGWETVLNKRGTTYRKLDEATKASLNADSAVQVLLDTPSMIKRPVLETDGTTLIGFKAEEYASLFK